MNLQDAIAVVTGASRGIGRAIAIALAQEGAHVACVARSSEAKPAKLSGTIEETVRQVQALGRRSLACSCDVTKDEEVDAMARRTLAEFGRIDILVNNAGVSFPAAFSDTPMKRWDLVMNVNLRGAVLCTKAFLPQMMEQSSGRIINISSYLAEAFLPGMLSYSVSKIALERLSQGLALELQPHGIAVNALRIEMFIASEGWTHLNPNVDYSTWEKPEAAAEAVVWLAGRKRTYSGHIITIGEVRRKMRGDQI